MSDTRSKEGKFVVAARKRACRLACSMGRKPVLIRPVFIVGCGRSGTTILGDTLGIHPTAAEEFVTMRTPAAI